MELPRFVLFKSLKDNKYLGHTSDGYGSFIRVDNLSLDAKHEVVMAKCGGGLVHIRHCRTGKYLRRYLDSDGVGDNFKLGGNLQKKYSDMKYFFVVDWVWLLNKYLKDAAIGEMKMRTLPRFVVFKSAHNNKYLCCDEYDPNGPNLLRFIKEDAMSQNSKHEVMMAKRGDGLVHIRCCSTGKYWRRRLEDNSWIAAKADKPEEDLSKWSCTLFWPCYDSKEDDNGVQLEHSQLGFHPMMINIKYRRRMETRLQTSSTRHAEYSYNTYLSLDVAQVCAVQGGRDRERKWSCPEDLSLDVKHEVVMAKCGGGLVHIRHCRTGKYLRRYSEGSTSLVVVADEPEEDQSKWYCTLFKPSPYTKDGVNVVLLQYFHRGEWSFLYRNSDGYFRVEEHLQVSGVGLHFIAVDWVSLMIKLLKDADIEVIVSVGKRKMRTLPRFVVFKSAHNNKYLC
ncbi:hypothetical protein RHMOL_Rhmol01G0301100 [Rhododendron molle]|uniref:Uncharacterized protein n=1 Tax=Rhododendron molle TaxID=49168 RepID=A0ACC0QAJ6_RHOML|nr:hypothetical protein RHMOL_Rhmol01G0301100 [Rhododendron molle]